MASRHFYAHIVESVGRAIEKPILASNSSLEKREKYASWRIAILATSKRNILALTVHSHVTDSDLR